MVSTLTDAVTEFGSEIPHNAGIGRDSLVDDSIGQPPLSL